MFLYKISQDVNIGYDTYDSAVVCAESEDDARMINPARYSCGNYEEWDGENDDFLWCGAKDVKVEIIGIASRVLPRGVVVASYNAG